MLQEVRKESIRLVLQSTTLDIIANTETMSCTIHGNIKINDDIVLRVLAQTTIGK